MSGIVGSRLNNRGSGLIGSLGTDGQVLTSSGAGAGAVYEAAAGGMSVSDITGATALGATPADTDEFVLSDAGVLKRVDYSYIKGGANTPAFQAHRTSVQSISNTTYTKIENDVELFDSDGAYDHSTNYRFTVPVGSAGKYLFGVSVNIHDLTDTGVVNALLYKNGSAFKNNIFSASRTIPSSATTITMDDASEGDYYEAYVKQVNVATDSLDLNYLYGNVFFGYRIIGA